MAGPLALLPVLAPLLGNVIERVLPDKDAAQKAQNELLSELISNASELQKASAEIVKAEAESKHWLTATWRPILMLSITAIIVNNFLLAPYAQALFGFGLQLHLPERLWDLLTLGVGGYVVGRSAEKVVETWKK